MVIASFVYLFVLVFVAVAVECVGEETKRRKIAKYNFIFLDHPNVCNPFLAVFFEYRIESRKKQQKNLSYLSSSSFVHPLYRLARLMCVHFTVSLLFFSFGWINIYFLGFVSACCTYRTKHTSTRVCTKKHHITFLSFKRK